MNILQLSKHMNGVNLHIIELSRQFQLMRHNIIVASSGGTHVEKLKNNNIMLMYLAL